MGFNSGLLVLASDVSPFINRYKLLYLNGGVTVTGTSSTSSNPDAYIGLTWTTYLLSLLKWLYCIPNTETKSGSEVILIPTFTLTGTMSSPYPPNPPDTYTVAELHVLLNGKLTNAQMREYFFTKGYTDCCFYTRGTYSSNSVTGKLSFLLCKNGIICSLFLYYSDGWKLDSSNSTYHIVGQASKIFGELKSS